MSAALDEVLNERGPAILPVPADDPRQSALLTSALRVGDAIDDDIAVVISTSGTTGEPKGAQLTAAALRAGAAKVTIDRPGAASITARIVAATSR